MARPAAKSRQQRTPLTRERVLRAAVALADEGGIESLSMRKLAQELGVEAMSLYNHVANKGDLIDAMVDVVLDEIELPSDDGPWAVAIRAYAISAHAALVRHRWACTFVITPATTNVIRPPRLRYMEWLLGRLREAGLSADVTYHAYHTLDSHILGFTLWQLGHAAGAKTLVGATGVKDFAELATRFMQQLGDDYPHIVEHAKQHMNAPPDDSEREFAFGLDLILEGLEPLRTVS